MIGVSWEQVELTQTNFGYFQRNINYHRFVEIECSHYIYDRFLIEIPLVHIRMGDSPTLRRDLNKQINLLNTLGYKHYNIITNRPKGIAENLT